MTETVRVVRGGLLAGFRAVGPPSILMLALLPVCGCSSLSVSREMQRLQVQQGFGKKYTGDVTKEDYVAPRDVVQTISINYEELNLTQQVGPDGRITMPLIGDVHVAGLPPRDIENMLTDLLGKYMKKVDITVVVQIRTNKVIFLAGAAGRGGVLAFTGDMTPFEILVKFPSNKFADLRNVKIIRPDPYHPEVYEYDHVAMSRWGDSSTNIQLRENDIIYIPLTWWGQLNDTIDSLMTPVKIVLGAASTLIRGLLIPAYIQGIDEIGDRIREGNLRGQGRGGGGIFF